MSAHRNHIKPELMEALEMLKFLVKRGRRLDFTAGLSWEMELEKLEAETMALALIPEDMAAFKQHLLKSRGTE
jgi:hypothetical protein